MRWRKPSLPAQVHQPCMQCWRARTLEELEWANGDNDNYNNINHDNNQTNKNYNSHIAPDNQEVMLELTAYIVTGGILPTQGGVTAAAKIITF